MVQALVEYGRNSFSFFVCWETLQKFSHFSALHPAWGYMDSTLGCTRVVKRENFPWQLQSTVRLPTAVVTKPCINFIGVALFPVVNKLTAHILLATTNRCANEKPSTMGAKTNLLFPVTIQLNDLSTSIPKPCRTWFHGRKQ